MFPVIVYKPADEKTDKRHFYTVARGKELEWRRCLDADQFKSMQKEGFQLFVDAVAEKSPEEGILPGEELPEIVEVKRGRKPRAK